MKKFLLAFLFVLLSTSALFAWIDTTGSTASSTSGEWETKDIFNDVHNRGISSLQVTITTSTQLDDFYLLYSTTTKEFYLLFSTGTQKIIDNQDKYYLTYSTTTGKAYVLQSTGTDKTNDLLNSMFVRDSTSTTKTYVLISTGTDTMVDGLDKIYLLISTSAADSDSWLNNLYILNSTGTDETIARLDTLINGVTVFIRPNNFPTDYPDSAAQSSLSSIDTNTSNTYNQMKSSVIVVNIDFTGKVSTGSAGSIFFDAGNAVQNIVLTNIACQGAYFYTEGGGAQITTTFSGGITSVREGIPGAIPIIIPVDSPTFNCTLDAGTTMFYSIPEVRKP